jgi:predicted phosphodiesterase
MSLADHYSEQPEVKERPYQPRVEFDGGRGVFDTGQIEGDAPADFGPIFRECLTGAGHDPDAVRIGRQLKESHWQQSRGLRDEFGRKTGEHETVWLHAYKFEVLRDGTPSADLEAIVKRARVQRRAATGQHWLVFQAGDQQIGKRARDGSLEETLERYVQSLDTAVAELRQLRRSHGIAGVQISMPGDCIEGGVSQHGKNMGYLTTLTVPEQVTVLQRLMLHTVEQFAPLAEQVMLDVVNGNHDQAQRQINTYPGDGWATQAATSIDTALKQNLLAYGHVTIRIPDRWSGSMTVPVGDTAVCVLHGHQWKTWHRALAWLSEQAVHNQPAGAADVVQYGHYHTHRVESHATKTLIGSPTFDCGSDHYRERHGAESRRGGLVYLLKGGEISRMTLV